MIFTIKDNTFYHFQIENDRLECSKKFLEKVNKNEVDLEQYTKEFKEIIQKYKIFLEKPIENKESILVLYKFYRQMLRYAYAAIDTIDVIETLDLEKREKFKAWAMQTRHLAEPLYKWGEQNYIPKYSEFLQKTELKKYSIKQIQNIHYSEMLDYLNLNKVLPPPEILEERSTSFYIQGRPIDIINIFQGESATQKFKEKQLFKITTKILQIGDTITGKTAQVGTATGKVCIIKSRKDMQKFQTGDIIVAPMTDPSYLPIMKQAKAFLTDEGGTLCHAAIVARELKIPCIIGTKIATELLSDGDIIELDANNGIVTILEKSK